MGGGNPKTVAENVRATYAEDDDGFEMADGAVANKWQGTAADRRDMSQLGRVQELRVRYASTLITPWIHRG